MARLVAFRDENGDRKRGALKGRLFCPPDVFAPLTDRELAAADRELKDLGIE
jgi:hypothetical protein